VTGSCASGSYSNASATVCSSCSAGTYQSTAGSSSCISCPGVLFLLNDSQYDKSHFRYSLSGLVLAL
jgi:hypothetical protein